MLVKATAPARLSSLRRHKVLACLNAVAAIVLTWVLWQAIRSLLHFYPYLPYDSYAARNVDSSMGILFWLGPVDLLCLLCAFSMWQGWQTRWRLQKAAVLWFGAFLCLELLIQMREATPFWPDDCGGD